MLPRCTAEGALNWIHTFSDLWHGKKTPSFSGATAFTCQQICNDTLRQASRENVGTGTLKCFQFLLNMQMVMLKNSHTLLFASPVQCNFTPLCCAVCYGSSVIHTRQPAASFVRGGAKRQNLWHCYQRFMLAWITKKWMQTKYKS